MPDNDQIDPGLGAEGTDDGLDQLFGHAKAMPAPDLPPALMRRLLADALANQPRPAPHQAARKSLTLAMIWSGLQDVFGGKQGVAGVSLAFCTAFGVGVFLPDATTDFIGLLSTTELSALDIETDPAVLWAEE